MAYVADAGTGGAALGINNMEYGYNSSNVEQYLEEIRTQALELAKAKVVDTAALKKCCQENWAGHACEEYLKILDRDAQHCAELFQELYDALKSEVYQLNAAMANKDESLFK